LPFPIFMTCTRTLYFCRISFHINSLLPIDVITESSMSAAHCVVSFSTGVFPFYVADSKFKFSSIITIDCSSKTKNPSDSYTV
jgi:hypothetical protein